MHVELPRLVKKPGHPVEYKRVDTQADLDEALAHGWRLRLEPEAPYAAVVDEVPPSEPGTTLPRLVKKPGGLHKRVNTRLELEAALSDGWMLRLSPETVAPAPENAPVEVVEGGPDLHNPQASGEPEPIVESPESPEPTVGPSDGNDGGNVEQAPDAPKVRKKPGRKPKVKVE